MTSVVIQVIVTISPGDPADRNFLSAASTPPTAVASVEDANNQNFSSESTSLMLIKTMMNTTDEYVRFKVQSISKESNK